MTWMTTQHNISTSTPANLEKILTAAEVVELVQKDLHRNPQLSSPLHVELGIIRTEFVAVVIPDTQNMEVTTLAQKV